MPRIRLFRRPAILAGVAAATAAVVAAVWSPAPAADHRDGPIFANTAMNGRGDLGDIFLMKSPAAPTTNVLLVATVSPFPGGGGGTPATFDQSITFDMKIDNNGDGIEDITLRMTFSAPNASGVQQVTVRGLPSTLFPPNGILATGQTGSNIALRGGGMFRAAIFDDPFFFDATGFGTLANNLITNPSMVNFPRPVGQAFNFFGPDVNTLAFVFDIPFSRVRGAANNTSIGMWSRTEQNGVQIDRTGRPAINTALIPPFPRMPQPRGERRNAFNAGQPRNDRRDFRADMISTLTAAPYSRPLNGTGLTGATNLANFLLPDILTYDFAAADGFPNGRRLRDDVIDIELNLLTGGAVTTDNVGDDNGDRISDGTMRPDGSIRPALFPYLGTANLPLNGAGNSFPRQ